MLGVDGLEFLNVLMCPERSLFIQYRSGRKIFIHNICRSLFRDVSKDLSGLLYLCRVYIISFLYG